MESKRIIALQKWTVGKFKTADAILVVVRSSLSNPLRSTYQFIGDLSKDADGQLDRAQSAQLHPACRDAFLDNGIGTPGSESTILPN